MGSNEDTTSTAEDFNSLEVTDPGRPTQTQGTVFGVNGISATGSSERDREIGYSDGRGNPGPNFEAFGGVTNEMGEPVGKVAQTPSEFNAALQATQGGDDSSAVSVPTIQAASSNLAPGILGETLSDFQSGVRDDSLAARGMVEGAVTPESGPLNMLEAAIASRPRDFSELDLIPTTGFLPAQVTRGKPTNLTSALTLLGALDKGRDIKAGMGDERGIDFGVTQQILPTPRPVDEIAARAMPGTAMGTTPQETGISRVGDDFESALNMIDARTKDTGTTTTRTTGGEDPFDPNVGRSFPVETLERAERLANEKTALERLGLPSLLSAVDPERISRDLMATSLIAGRPIRAVEAIRGVQAPNLQKETMEEYQERTGARIPESQIITDDSGLVIGIKDAQGNLVTGMDPNAPQTPDDNVQTPVKKAVAPKAPTDPCPDGYQLIDGKCTLVDTDDKGTGFITFPPDRNPPFQPGPFQPKSKATPIVGISGLNPITFNNPFRR